MKPLTKNIGLADQRAYTSGIWSRTYEVNIKKEYIITAPSGLTADIPFFYFFYNITHDPKPTLIKTIAVKNDDPQGLCQTGIISPVIFNHFTGNADLASDTAAYNSNKEDIWDSATVLDLSVLSDDPLLIPYPSVAGNGAFVYGIPDSYKLFRINDDGITHTLNMEYSTLHGPIDTPPLSPEATDCGLFIEIPVNYPANSTTAVNVSITVEATTT